MYNSIFVIGRLTEDPRLNTYEDQYSVCSITLAVNRPFKNSEGDVDCDFIRISLWDSYAKTTYEFCHKGDIVGVRGRLQNRVQELNVSSPDGEQKKRIYSNEVIGERIIFIDTKKRKEVVE